MSNLKLIYFDFPGRAEAIRLALTIGEIPFSDERILPSEFLTARDSFPYKSLPVIEVDDAQYAQSIPLLRYCGKLAGLYPSDPLEALKVDEIMDTVVDLITGVENIHRRDGGDDPKHEHTMHEYLKIAVPRFLGGIDRRSTEWYPESSFIASNELTIADLVLYVLHLNVSAGTWHHFDVTWFENLPRVRAAAEAVGEHPKVLAWNKDMSRRAAEVRKTEDPDDDNE